LATSTPVAAESVWPPASQTSPLPVLTFLSLFPPLSPPFLGIGLPPSVFAFRERILALSPQIRREIIVFSPFSTSRSSPHDVGRPSRILLVRSPLGLLPLCFFFLTIDILLIGFQDKVRSAPVLERPLILK